MSCFWFMYYTGGGCHGYLVEVVMYTISQPVCCAYKTHVLSFVVSLVNLSFASVCLGMLYLYETPVFRKWSELVWVIAAGLCFTVFCLGPRSPPSLEELLFITWHLQWNGLAYPRQVAVRNNGSLCSQENSLVKVRWQQQNTFMY